MVGNTQLRHHEHKPPFEGAVGGWERRQNFTGRKSFGRYHCKCSHTWQSSKSFPNVKQGCLQCATHASLPCCLWRNTSRDQNLAAAVQVNVTGKALKNVAPCIINLHHDLKSSIASRSCAAYFCTGIMLNCVCLHACVYVRMHVCTHARMYVCMWNAYLPDKGRRKGRRHPAN